MISSGILEYGRPVDVLKNYTIGSSIEVNLEAFLYILQQGWADIDRKKYIMGSGPYMNLKKILIIGKLSITNENHNIRNIIWNFQSGKTRIFVRRVETTSQRFIWTVITQVTYTMFFSVELY